jgi:hypothetical protein
MSSNIRPHKHGNPSAVTTSWPPSHGDGARSGKKAKIARDLRGSESIRRRIGSAPANSAPGHVSRPISSSPAPERTLVDQNEGKPRLQRQPSYPAALATWGSTAATVMSRAVISSHKQRCTHHTLARGGTLSVDVRTPDGWRPAPPSLVTSLDGRPLSPDMQPSQRAPTEWERSRRRPGRRRRAPLRRGDVATRQTHHQRRRKGLK